MSHSRQIAQLCIQIFDFNTVCSLHSNYDSISKCHDIRQIIERSKKLFIILFQRYSKTSQTFFIYPFLQPSSSIAIHLRIIYNYSPIILIQFLKNNFNNPRLYPSSIPQIRFPHPPIENRSSIPPLHPHGKASASVFFNPPNNRPRNRDHGAESRRGGPRKLGITHERGTID